MRKSLNIPALDDALIKAGMNQAGLAEKLNVSREAVSKWMKGESFPAPAKLLRIGMLLGLAFEQLVTLPPTAAVPVVSFRKPATKKPASKTPPAPRAIMNYNRLVATIVTTSEQTTYRAAVAVNQWLVIRNWLVGAYLVEFEQNGSDRAKYGTRLLDNLAGDLAARKVKGLDVRTLRDCRKLFIIYPQIRGTVDPELKTKATRLPICGSLTRELAGNESSVLTVESGLLVPIRGPADPESGLEKAPPAPTPLSSELLARFSWTQLRELMVIDDPWKRAFYENEILTGRWSKRQLQRQIETLLYERTGLSTHKKAVIERARKQEPPETIEDLIRDPYVLEFTGLADRAEYSENDLETALLNHIQRFLLELGSGFCFEARQFRITTGNKHHRVDLVFYHRRLRCHVLIDLKIRGFQPADAGQMNFYVNWFKTNMMAEGDHPPVGIILCSGRDHTDVEFATAGMDSKLFVSRYLVALPSVDQLKALLEADRALIASAKKQHR